MTLLPACLTPLFAVTALLVSPSLHAFEEPPAASREEQRQSLEEDFHWPKLTSERRLKTYADVKESLRSVEGLDVLLQRGNDAEKLARSLPDDFPIGHPADDIIIRWYDEVVGDHALSRSSNILIVANPATRKQLENTDTDLLQQSLELIHPPGLTPVLLEYKMSQFTVKIDAKELPPRTPNASYDLFLSSDTSSTTATLEVIESQPFAEGDQRLKITGDLSLCLLSKPRKIVAEITPPQSLKQYQRYLRTGRFPRVARYGDFEIRFKSIERQTNDAASLTLELNYPDRPFFFESHMTPSLVGKTTLTFPQRGDAPNTLTCERTGVNGQYEALDLVEDTVQRVDWDLPITGMEVEVAPLLRRLNVHVEIDSPLSPR